ncbi:hypothetical protein JCM24511_00811 [Saitozyma sp. JCM 24511]|nr:hypothetical protein JCM24511_00811 [Saitozyma sp. JCM 24511]
MGRMEIGVDGMASGLSCSSGREERPASCALRRDEVGGTAQDEERRDRDEIGETVPLTEENPASPASHASPPSTMTLLAPVPDRMVSTAAS